MEDSKHGLSDLLHPWRIVGIRVYTTSDWGQTLLPIETAAEGGVLILRGGVGSRFSLNKYPGIEQCQKGGLGATLDPPPTPCGSSDLSGFLPGGAHTPPVPSGGMPGGGMTRRTNLRVYFSHRHLRDAIVILEEGNWPYPC